MRSKIQLLGLLGGPLLAIVCFWLVPIEYQDADNQIVEFGSAGRATLAVMVWMAVWWLTEAIDLSATALLPMVLFPILGISNMAAATAPYANQLIFLFMGGFLQALSMQRWGLDRRIALLTLRIVGTKPVNMVGGFMLVTAVLSAFVSNTATAAMMLPIALSVVALTKNKSNPVSGFSDAAETEMSETSTNNFATCLMLGIAYAASIGGVATIIGTPPNVFLISFIQDTISAPYQIEISFAKWMLIGVPFAIVFLPIVWVLLTRVIYPIRLPEISGGKQLIERERQKQGPFSRGELITFLVFCLTATTWITRPWLAEIHWTMADATWYPLSQLTDAGIAMTGACLLFVIPVANGPGGNQGRRFAMDWQTAEKLPWGILILFGGGLSLAAAVEANGVSEFIGNQSRFLSGVPDIWLVLVVCASVIFLTELTSNTATAATLLPVLAALAPGLNVHPFLLIFPTAIAASCAFMLPVATPPNAIVFASGNVSIRQMASAGLWFNLVAVILITLLTFFVIAPLLGI